MLYMTCMQDQSYYYLSHDKKPMGPLSRPQLEAKLSMGEIEATTLVAAVGGNEWVTLNDLLGMVSKDETEVTPVSSISTTLSCPHCAKEQEVSQDAVLLRCPACTKEVAPDPKSSLWAHFTSCMRRYACFKGRATRKEYWSFILFNIIFSIPAGLGLGITLLMNVFPTAMQLEYTESQEASQALEAKMAEMTSLKGMLEAGGSVQIFCILTIVVGYLFMLPLLGVTIRRFHDVGFAGYIPTLSLIMGIVMQSLDIFFNFKSEEITLLTIITGVLSVIILVFSLLDSEKGSNKYGPSSKFPHY